MIGDNIIELNETTSTNRFTSELLSKEKLPDGTIITARYQSCGKGAGENIWESAEGKNLTVSIVLHPEFLPLERQFILNKMVSLGVYDMISKLVTDPSQVKIKWPNDVYVGNKKISGMLIENTIIGNTFQHSILGIGININQEVFSSDAPNPISLKNITGKEYNLRDCLTLLCSCLEKRYGYLRNEGINLLDEDYLSALYRKGESALYIYKNEMISATIIDISEEGMLILETMEGKIIECDFKEIVFLQ
jgi:BirA family transcriptional regulator, biotin operon repressor / biotin---[acetyl-CoA-carboxylase] ligase